MSSNRPPISNNAAEARDRMTLLMSRLGEALVEWTQVSSYDWSCMTEEQLRRMASLQGRLGVASYWNAAQLDAQLEVRHDQSVKSRLVSRINDLEARILELEE